MTITTSLRTTVAATLVCVGSFSAHAQGLGGFLSKAKEKVNQASSASPGRVTQTATQAVQGNDGELPPRPRDVESVDLQDRYMREVLANTRPYDPDDRETADDSYRRLIHVRQYPLKITWDRSAVDYYASKDLMTMDLIDDMCSGIGDILNNPTISYYSKPHFLKIKEVHFSTTQTPPTTEEKCDDGYNKSWNPATGVLTLSLCTRPNYTVSLKTFTYSEVEVAFSEWVLKHVN